MSPSASESVARERPLGVTDIQSRGEVIYFSVVDRFFDEVRFFARNDTTVDRLIAGLHERLRRCRARA